MPYLSSGGVRDQDLTSRAVRLYAGGEVDVAPYYPILHSFRRADIAHHHWASMNPDAHFYFGQVFLPVLLVDRRHGELHRHGARHCPLRIILLPDGSTKEHKDRVANDLINSAAVLLDDWDHRGQIAIENRNDPLRC